MSLALLRIGPDRLQAHHWERGRLQQAGEFSTSEVSLAAFSSYLQSDPARWYRILLNSGDEHWHAEPLPRLGLSDRQQWIARKCRQRYPDDALHLAIPQRHAQTGQQLLLASPGPGSLLAPWLERLEQGRHLLSGIYTLAQLAPCLLRRLGHPKRTCLLTIVLTRSIRQVYLEEGQVGFVRHVAIREGQTMTANLIAQESRSLYQYLIGQQKHPREQGLNVHLMPPPGMQAPPLPANEPDLTFGLLEPLASASKLKIPADMLSNESIFLTLLAKYPPRHQFAPASLRQAYLRQRTDRYLRHAGVGLLLCATLFAGEQLQRASQAETETLAQQTTLDASRVAISELAAAQPALVDHEQYQHFIDTYHQLAARRGFPEKAVEAISEAMRDESRLTLDRMAWTTHPAAPAEASDEFTLQGKVSTSVANDAENIRSKLAQTLGPNAGLTLLPQASPQPKSPSLPEPASAGIPFSMQMRGRAIR